MNLRDRQSVLLGVCSYPVFQSLYEFSSEAELPVVLENGETTKLVIVLPLGRADRPNRFERRRES